MRLSVSVSLTFDLFDANSLVVYFFYLLYSLLYFFNRLPTAHRNFKNIIDQHKIAYIELYVGYTMQNMY